jgi:hypothetical protein
VKSATAAPGSFAARCAAAFGRNATILNALVLLASAAGCCFLYSHGLSMPAAFSLLHGPWGVAVGVVGVFLALAATPQLRHCLLIGWLCIWFTTGLAELRGSFLTDGIVVGGIIPYSDANNFLREASRLVEGQNLTAWASRPLSDTYLAGHLCIAGGNVALALALAGIFSAAAIGLAAVEVRRTMGLLAATLWTWMLLVYCRRYLGQMLSEQAGVAFGALGVALLMRAFAANAVRCLWPGLFLLSLALNARAGAMLILPVLVAAAAWRWQHPGRVRVLVLATMSVAAAFILSFGFLKLLGAPRGQLMANYHDIAYGIVFGGNWEKPAADIPNYNQMDRSERVTEIDRRIAAAVRANPSLIWRGAARNWSDFFTRSKAALGPFSFFMHPNTEYVLLALSGLGLLWSLAVSHRLSPLILAAGVGIVLSVPFLPTSDADRMRIYAATMPVMFLIPAFSLAGWRAWMGRFAPSIPILSRSEPNVLNDAADDSPGLLYCVLPYLAVMLLVPLFARFVAPSGPAVSLRERGPDTELTLDVNRATWIELTSSSDSRRSNTRYVPADLFKRNIFGSFHAFYPKQAGFLESLSRPGVALVCPGSTETAFLIIDARHLKEKGRKVVVLGRSHAADANYDPTFLENSLENPAILRQRAP